MVANFGSMKVNASELRTPLRVQSFVGSPDGHGGTDGTWVDWPHVIYGKVEWSKGRELFVAMKLQPVIYAKITARWDSRLTAKNRIILPPPIPEGIEEGILNIRGVWNIEMRNHFMEFIVDAGVGS